MLLSLRSKAKQSMTPGRQRREKKPDRAQEPHKGGHIAKI